MAGGPSRFKLLPRESRKLSLCTGGSLKQVSLYMVYKELTFAFISKKTIKFKIINKIRDL